jgi:hypothetical protein
MLWRKKSDDEGGEGRYIALPALKYERSASLALSRVRTRKSAFTLTNGA